MTSVILTWQEWADTIKTDMLDEIAKLRPPLLNEDELHEISRLLGKC